MAYAAVLSLDQVLEQISNPHLEQHQTPLRDQQIKSLQEKLNFLLDFLNDSLQRRSEEVQILERKIRDAACKAADLIELHISKNFGQEGFQERQMRNQTFCENLEIVADEIDSIKTNAAELKKMWGATDPHQSQRTSLPARLSSIGKNATVGRDNDLIEIRDRLTRDEAPLRIIQVTGMGGIGKTTLAKNVYDLPRIASHFDIRAWVSISQEYHEREVLLSLQKQLNAENATKDLKECVYKSLKGRRYLVVMDDVWTTEAWDSLRRIFPDDGNGSWVMMTTRLSSVVDSHGFSHQMQFLDETDSWTLLRQKVFENGSCPRELEEAGKEIAENCKGFPLSLVVIGGHLSKANRTKDHWEYVAQNVKSVVDATDGNCSEILSLSYDYLPHYLRACFLYMGVFPEDHEIRVSILIKLWVAEGFLKPVRGKTLEEVAEEYLRDLISRNLIMISKESSGGKIKACSIHDTLRDLCLKKAQEEKFFHVRDRDEDNNFDESTRRLCIHPDILCEEFNRYQSMGSLPLVRSIIPFSKASYSHLTKSQIKELVDGKPFPLLRVLELPELLNCFPSGEIKLVHSRYIAFNCLGIVSMFKTLPDFLWNLQTLIVKGGRVHLPEEIWRMTQLRHLLFRQCFLPCPARSPIDGENFVLGNLLTLSNVSSSSCTKEVFERVPNLNKLGILVDEFEVRPIFLRNLVNLPQLETLKIDHYHGPVPIDFTFPINIKKLTFYNCKIAWKHMTIVGLMPNLEVLKLQSIWGPERKWELTKGEFCTLKSLQIRECFLVQLRANNTNFTSLEHLMLRKCSELKEIPPSFEEIPTLQIIDLDDASPSAVISAQQIQVAQKDFGNDRFHVHVERRFNRPQNKELEAEVIAKFESHDDNKSYIGVSMIRSLSKGSISRIVPRLLEDDHPQLQLAAAEAIALFSFDHINILIELGAVPIMVLIVLGNIARDSANSRDLVLSYGVLMPLLAQFKDKTNPLIMKMATQTLSNLCLRKPQFEQVKSVILPLSYLIHEKNLGVVEHACEALFHLTCGKMDIRQAVIDADVFPRLVELLPFCQPVIPYLALCIIGNIISYVDDTKIQVIIDKKALLHRLCDVLSPSVLYGNVEATCYIISNIIGRTKDHIQAVIEAGIISPILQQLQDVHHFKAASEVIYNVTTKGTNEQIKFLVDKGCIEPMCDLLEVIKIYPKEKCVIKICLEGLENILKVGEAEKNQGNTEDVNVFAQMIEDAGGLQKIKNLQTHDYRKIRRIAVKILVTYWHQENDNDEDPHDGGGGSVMMSTKDEDEDEDDEDSEEDHDDDDDDDDGMRMVRTLRGMVAQMKIRMTYEDPHDGGGGGSVMMSTEDEDEDDEDSEEDHDDDDDDEDEDGEDSEEDHDEDEDEDEDEDSVSKPNTLT